MYVCIPYVSYINTYDVISHSLIIHTHSIQNFVFVYYMAQNVSCFTYSEEFCRLMPFKKSDTTSQRPLGFCSAKYCIGFPCFPPHVRLPQVPVGRTSGSSPSRVHGSHRRPRLAAFEISHVKRGMQEVARAS